MNGAYFYGIADALLQRSFFPRFFPFPHSVVHGWQIQGASSFEADCNPAGILVWSQDDKSRISNYFPAEKIHVVGAPYLYLPDAESLDTEGGALYSLPHSSHFAKIGVDHAGVEKNIENLKEQYKKVSLLSYYLNVDPEIARIARKLDVTIYSVGGLWDVRFMLKLKQLLRSFDFFVASEGTTGMLYAAWEGLQVDAIDLTKFCAGSDNVYSQQIVGYGYQELKALRARLQQRSWVAEQIGAEHVLSREEMTSLVGAGYYAVRKAPLLKAWINTYRTAKRDRKNLDAAKVVLDSYGHKALW